MDCIKVNRCAFSTNILQNTHGSFPRSQAPAHVLPRPVPKNLAQEAQVRLSIGLRRPKAVEADTHGAEPCVHLGACLLDLHIPWEALRATQPSPLSLLFSLPHNCTESQTIVQSHY